MFTGDLAYEYLAHEYNQTLGTHYFDWPAQSPSTGYACSSFTTPCFPMFVPTLLYSLGSTQHLSGMTLRPSLCLPRRHFLGDHPPHSTTDVHPNPTVVKANLRSTMSEKNGAVVCAKTSSTISTNASDILGTWGSKRCVSPVGKLSAVGRTIRSGIIPNIARGWTSGGMGISGLKALLSKSTNHLRRLENGFCGERWYCKNRIDARYLTCFLCSS